MSSDDLLKADKQPTQKSTMWHKRFDALVAILFLYFAYLQLNDIDPLKWIFIYVSIAAVAILSYFNFILKIHRFILFGIFTIYTIANISMFTSWIDAGLPAFIDYEPTTVKVVEEIREFIGLIICLIISGYYFWRKDL